MKQPKPLVLVLFPVILALSLLAVLGVTLPKQAARAAGAEIPGRLPLENPNEFDYPASAASLTVTRVFTDVSLSGGLGPPTQFQHMPGQAWADFNRDGWVDLYLTGGINPNTLYMNNGDGTFELSGFTAQVALTDSLSGGAVFGDYDNDGWPDLYVLANSENGQPGNTLFHNEGGQGFTDTTSQAGVGDLGVGTSGSWGDYDRDGYLDLYIANWFCNTCPNGNRDTLYHNNRDGTFTDVTSALGAVTEGPGFVASFLDYDNDGDLDLYLVNDKAFSGPPLPPHPGHNILWRNDGPGCGSWCFTDVSAAAGADVAVDGMGLAVGDYDNDGDLDLYFSNAGPQVLLQNQTSQGSPVFLDVSIPAGVGFDAIGWGTVFLDYDNDSWQDLYLATMNSDPWLANRLYHNQGDGTFLDVSAGSGADDAGQTLGVAYADYNKDGWVDLVIGNLGEPYTLLRNEGTTGAGGHWLTAALSGGGPVNQDAVGARLEVVTTNGLTLTQEVKSGSSLGSGNELALHFGLGSAAVETVTVRWPDGLEETFSAVPENTIWALAYPQADILLTEGFSVTTTGGHAITLTHRLTNTGNRADTFQLSALSTLGTATLIQNELALEPGADALIRVRVSVPETPGATGEVTVTALSANDPSVTLSTSHQIYVVRALLHLPISSK